MQFGQEKTLCSAAVETEGNWSPKRGVKMDTCLNRELRMEAEMVQFDARNILAKKQQLLDDIHILDETAAKVSKLLAELPTSEVLIREVDDSEKAAFFCKQEIRVLKALVAELTEIAATPPKPPTPPPTPPPEEDEDESGSPSSSESGGGLFSMISKKQGTKVSESSSAGSGSGS